MKNSQHSYANQLRSATRRGLVLVAMCAAIGAVSGTEARADRQVHRQNLGSNPVKGCIEFYSRSSGNSGYYRILNTTNQNLKYRIRIVLNDGNSTTRVVHAASGGYSGSASFSYAGFNRVGIHHVELLYAHRE